MVSVTYGGYGYERPVESVGEGLYVCARSILLCGGYDSRGENYDSYAIGKQAFEGHQSIYVSDVAGYVHEGANDSEWAEYGHDYERDFDPIAAQIFAFSGSNREFREEGEREACPDKGLEGIVYALFQRSEVPEVDACEHRHKCEGEHRKGRFGDAFEPFEGYGGCWGELHEVGAYALMGKASLAAAYGYGACGTFIDHIEVYQKSSSKQRLIGLSAFS